MSKIKLSKTDYYSENEQYITGITFTKEYNYYIDDKYNKEYCINIWIFNKGYHIIWNSKKRDCKIVK